MVLNIVFFLSLLGLQAQNLRNPQTAGFEVSLCAAAPESAPRTACPLSHTTRQPGVWVLMSGLWRNVPSEHPWLTAATDHAAMVGCFSLPKNRQVSEWTGPSMGPEPCTAELSDVLSSAMVLEKLLRYIILYILPISPYCFT